MDLRGHRRVRARVGYDSRRLSYHWQEIEAGARERGRRATARLNAAVVVGRWQGQGLVKQVELPAMPASASAGNDQRNLPTASPLGCRHVELDELRVTGHI